MSTIKIEFPAEDKVAAAAFSTALATIAGDQIVAVPAVQEHTHHQDAPGASTTAVDDQFAADSEQEHEEEPGKSAEPAATETTQTTGTAEAAASAGNDAPRDTKGVPFDSNFCGQAKDPYYGSGKRAGQWKKRKGVDDAAYDTWYAEKLAKLAPPAGQQEEAPVNTAGAFAPPAAAGGATPPPPAASNAPQDTGSFMGWVSEKQAAGALTQEQVNAAWAEAGVEMGDLFNKAPEEVAANIKKVYDVLVAKVGA